MNYKYKVLGINRLDFINDEGAHINGVQLWVAAPTASSNWTDGLEVFKVWKDYGTPLFEEIMQLHPGNVITGECDRKGRPLSIVRS